MTSRQRWTLVATIIGSGAVFLDGTIVNVALKQHRPGAAGDSSSASSRARPTSSAATSRSSPPCSSSPAPSPTTTAGGASTPSGWSGSPRRPRCAASPRRSSRWSSSGSLQGAAGALLVPGSLALITARLRRRRARPRVRDLGGRDLGADASSGRSSAASSSTPSAGGSRSSSTSRSSRFALWATLRHVAGVARHGGDRAVRLARRAGRGPGRRRPRVRAHPRPGSNAWADTARLGRARRRGRRARRCSRSSWPAGRTRSSRSASSGRGRSRSINLATFLIYGALYVTFCYQALVLQGVLGYTALGGRARSACRSGIMLTLLSTRVGTLAGRIGPRRFLVAGPLLMAAGAALVRPPPGRLARRGWPSLDDPVDASSRRVDVLIDVLPGVAPLRARDLAVVAPLTSTLMGSIPGRFSGLGLGDQQRDLAGRPAAPRRAHLHRRSARRSTRRSATLAPASTRPIAGGPDGVPAAQPAAAGRHARGGRRRERRPRSTPSTSRCSSAAACSCRRRSSSWFGLRRAAGAPAELPIAATPPARRRRLTGRARCRPSVADPERRAVARDDDVGGGEDARPARLDRRLVVGRAGRPRASGPRATTGGSARRPRRRPRR